MSRYPNEGVARFDQQFAKTTEERNNEHWRRRARQRQRAIETLDGSAPIDFDEVMARLGWRREDNGKENEDAS